MSPTSIFASASTPADAIVDLSYFVVAIAAGIFVAVAGFLIYAVVQFRNETEDDQSEPPQVYGSNEVEIAWTVIPILIVIVLFLATAGSIASIQGGGEAARAGFHVLPPGRSGNAWMTWQATVPTAALIVVTVGQALLGGAARIYVVGFLVLGTGLGCHASRLARERSHASARRLLLASIVYLPALLLLILAEKTWPAISVFAQLSTQSG